MNTLFHVNELFTLSRIRRLLLTLFAGLLILVATTACSTTPGTTANSVPEATSADVSRAQDNLSDQSVNENNLSRQAPQQRRGASSINETPAVR